MTKPNRIHTVIFAYFILGFIVCFLVDVLAVGAHKYIERSAATEALKLANYKASKDVTRKEFIDGYMATYKIAREGINADISKRHRILEILKIIIKIVALYVVAFRCSVKLNKQLQPIAVARVE